MERSSDSSTPEELALLRDQVARLERERHELQNRAERLEEENRNFAKLCLQVQAQNEAITNLYVASHRLHATFNPIEIMKIIEEILLDLVGAEEFGVFLLEEKAKLLRLVAGKGLSDKLPAESLPAGEGVIGDVTSSGEPFFFSPKSSADFEARLPMAAIPLKMNGTSVGAIVIYKLLNHKCDFSPVDHELLQLLAAHAATALVTARLHGAMDRKLKTVEGFIQMMKST